MHVDVNKWQRKNKVLLGNTGEVTFMHIFVANRYN